eukprot:scaffold322168_cov36-Tisochrysis_lutea.AAC.1
MLVCPGGNDEGRHPVDAGRVNIGIGLCVEKEADWGAWSAEVEDGFGKRPSFRVGADWASHTLTSSSLITAGVWPLYVAVCRAVVPSSVRALTSARASISNKTTSMWPRLHAIMSGVAPSGRAALTAAPWVSKVRTRSALGWSEACVRAVPPSWKVAFAHAPRESAVASTLSWVCDTPRSKAAFGVSASANRLACSSESRSSRPSCRSCGHACACSAPASASTVVSFIIGSPPGTPAPTSLSLN